MANLTKTQAKKRIGVKKEKITDDEMLTMIRYSEKFVSFSKNEYDHLIDKYRDNSLVSSYLDSCLEYKAIKEVVKNYLMQEKLCD